MPLHEPYFQVKKCKSDTVGDFYSIKHNLDGSLDFAAHATVDDEIGRLLLLAIEEGKRQQSKAFLELLNYGRKS